MKNTYKFGAVLFIVFMLCVYLVEWIYRAPPLTQLMIIIGVFLFFTSPCIVYITRALLCGVTYSMFLKPDPRSFLEADVFSGIVLPSDLDFLLHMNNARYKREIDFARISFFFKSGVFQMCIAEGRRFPVMVASTGRYRRSLTLFQTFKIHTKLVYWDEEKLYFEQRFVARFKENKEFTYQINLLAFKSFNQSPEELMLKLLPNLPGKPAISKEIESFIALNEASSLSLKSEAKKD